MTYINGTVLKLAAHHDKGSEFDPTVVQPAMSSIYANTIGWCSEEGGRDHDTGHFILMLAGCTYWVGVVVLYVLLVVLLWQVSQYYMCREESIWHYN